MDIRPMTPKDLFAFKCFGDARLSPDGKNLAYVRQYHDAEKEKSYTEIWLYSLETGASRRLTGSGKDRSPRWSPDGQRLAFVSDRSGKSQIWIIEPSGGEAWRIPTKEEVRGDFVWSPDGKRIFFTSQVFAKPDDWQPYPGAPEDDRARAVEQANRALKPKDEKPKDDSKPNDIKVITRLRYRMDGQGYFGDLRRHVFWVEVPSGPVGDKEEPARQLTSGDYDHSLPDITPCGRYAILSARRSEDADYQLKSDLWLLEIETGKHVLLYDAPGPTSGPQVSPDGRYVAFFGHDLARNVSTRTDLYVLAIQDFIERVSRGEEAEPLTLKNAVNLTARLDRGAGHLGGSEPRYQGAGGAIWQGADIYFPLMDCGETFIYKASRRQASDEGQTEPSHDWKLERVFGTPGRSIGGFDLKAGRMAFQASTPETPEDVFVLKDGAEIRVTTENDELVKSLALGKCEKFRYLSKDGQELDGWLIYPHGYEPGKKYPLLLLVHGGPHGAYGSSFMFGAQLFASNGYAVAYCNPRGSSSYGQEFMAVIDGDWGNKDYMDVMACVDAVVSRGSVDENNIFVHGWSYGGYWTLWAITQTGRFKAACAGASVSNLHSDYGTSDIMWADEHEYGGKPWENADLLLDRSPLSHVANVTTPVLLLHGENDLRCPISQSEQFYIGLKRLGKTAVFVRYPDEYHGLRRHLHRIDRYKRMFAWFEYYRTQPGS
ncbi:MAG TPA: S9 family peptidase [Firmicutes bacterium]|nr:S9 family peptidase [Candidatus Fermentithermobacillaceae bacterium]